MKFVTNVVRLSPLLVALLFSVSAFAAPKTLRLGVTAKSAEEKDKNFGPLIAHLAKSTEAKFEVAAYPTYEALYDAFKKRQVDLALVGAVKYVEAKHEVGAIPVVSEGGLVRTVIVAAKSSPLKRATELKGKRFAFGYADSTSTHLMPLLLLSKNHVKQTDLGRSSFVGTDQQKIVDAVVAGQADAGGIIESVYQRNRDKLKVLEFSAPFPGGPIIAQKGTDAATIDKVRKLFLAFKAPGAPRFAAGSVAVKDADFNQIRFLCKVLFGKTYV